MTLVEHPLTQIPNIFFEYIYDFWYNNPSYWIPVTNKDKEVIDKIIYEKFYNIYYINCKKDFIFDKNNNKFLIGFIIFQDQFYRHFDRYQIHNSIKQDFNNTIIHDTRLTLVQNIVSIIDNIILDVNEKELIFILMLFKHIKNYKYVIENCYKWTLHNNCSIHEKMYLSKFFNDTYKKMFDFDYISNNVQLFNQTNYLIDFDPQSICDYFPSQYKNDDWLNTINLDHPSIKILSTILLDSLLDSLIVDNKIIVSLSGGVDSMVTLFLLIHLKINKKINKEIIACHIIYCNRY